MGKVNRVPVICQWQSAVESGIGFGIVGIVCWGLGSITAHSSGDSRVEIKLRTLCPVRLTGVEAKSLG